MKSITDNLKNTRDNVENEIISKLVGKCGEMLVQSVKNHALTYIKLRDYESGYQELQKIIYKLDPVKYDLNRKLSASTDWFELETGASYRIRLKSGDMIFVKQILQSYQNGPEYDLLELYIFGRNRELIRAKLMKRVYYSRREDKILIKKSRFILSISTHKFSNLILPEETKRYIIEGLYNWHKSKEWYKSHELIHKIGLFLYGKPGTGKSTIARCISSMFGNAPIITVDYNDVSESIQQVNIARRQEPSVIIVLMEDIDMIFGSRETEEVIDNTDETGSNDNNKTPIETDKKKDKKENISMNEIFQLLDGIYSTEDTIYIATTNYKERIDPALIRYGRFDLQCELKYFEKEEVIQFMKLFGLNEKDIEEFHLTYPVQPAFLQSKIMEWRAKHAKELIKK